jgi:hypothetical protein
MALLLLALDLSTYMTGSVIEVDGGHLVSTPYSYISRTP